MRSGIVPRREALISAVMVFAVSCFSMLIITMIAHFSLKNEITSYIKSYAILAASEVNGDDHKNMISSDQKDSPEYLKLQLPFNKILAANPRISSIYTMVQKGDKMYFVVDSTQASSTSDKYRTDTAGVMEEYTDATPTMLESFKERKAMVEDELGKDEWGYSISGYAPVYDSKNDFIGIAGVDMNASAYWSSIGRIWYSFCAGLVMSAAICFIIYMYVLKNAMVKLANLRENQRQISVMRAFNVQMRDITSIATKASSNIGVMAGEIVKMTHESVDKTEEAARIIRGSTGRIESVGLVCNQLSDSALTMESAADSSRSSISNTVDRLHSVESIAKELTDATHNIAGVVAIITDITEKIDLLALNATIEAARAGDAGKGFAVVAGEVKALSEQTAQATKRISEYVAALQRVSSEVTDSVTGVVADISQVEQNVSNSSSSIGLQKELVHIISSDISGATQSAAVVERMVSSVTITAQKTEESTHKLFEALNLLSEQNLMISKKVESFLRDMNTKEKDI